MFSTLHSTRVLGHLLHKTTVITIAFLFLFLQFFKNISHFAQETQDDEIPTTCMHPLHHYTFMEKELVKQVAHFLHNPGFISSIVIWHYSDNNLKQKAKISAKNKHNHFKS